MPSGTPYSLDFAGYKIDALVVSGLPNVRYLTGFTGSHGMALWTRNSLTLFTDPRYKIQASRECSCKVSIVKGPLLYLGVARAITRRKLKRIGFEKERLTFEEHDAIRESTPMGVWLRPVSGLVEQLRIVKSGDEIARIRRSVQTNSKAFDRAIRHIKSGIAEFEIAAEIDYQMRKLGADSTAFATIVAAGERTALPHAHPTAQRLNGNALLLVDMGAVQDGYNSDMTRMLHLGTPNQKIKEMYRAVLDAQLAAIDAVRPGVSADKVDRAARDVLKTAGLDKNFVHSTGHGLGLEIHEAPRLGRKAKTELAAGMVVTIEPGAYVEGVGGIRIEDTVLVTANGCEVLTPTSKELKLL